MEYFLRKILVPIDNSLSSLMAQETAAMIAKKTEAVVTLLQVIPESRWIYDYSTKMENENLYNLERRSEGLLAKAKSFFSEENVTANTETTRNNDPATGILNFPAADCDLIIIGACGEHETDLCKLGNTTRKVTSQTRRPILIVKKANTISNILVCVDGSGNSIEALKFSTKLAKKLGARITLLNIQQGLPDAMQNLGEKAGRLVLSMTLNSVEEKQAEATLRVEFGTPSNVIGDVAEEGKFDLIVLGSRGLGTTERALLGSVSEDVSQNANCSVLIVPRPE
jgi:nucleotide-binding universal stress UspA family protein